MALSAEAARELRDVIDDALKNPEVVEEPAGEGIPEDFCAIWPQANPVLRGIAAAAFESRLAVPTACWSGAHSARLSCGRRRHLQHDLRSYRGRDLN